MNIIISPAKTMDFETPLPFTVKLTEPLFHREARELNDILKKFSPGDIKKLMKISDALTESTFLNIQSFVPVGMRPALFAYTGLVFKGIGAYDFSCHDFEFARRHLFILSGLYGVLRPSDGISPYRLEIKTPLPNGNGKNLYSFWQPGITGFFNNKMPGEVLLNLASNEYFKGVNKAGLAKRVISFRFLEGSKNVPTYAKQARGEMVRFIVKNRIVKPENLKGFNRTGYAFSPGLSGEDEMVFVR